MPAGRPRCYRILDFYWATTLISIWDIRGSQSQADKSEEWNARARRVGLNGLAIENLGRFVRFPFEQGQDGFELGFLRMVVRDDDLNVAG